MSVTSFPYLSSTAYVTFGGKSMLKFPEFLFADAAICANFFLEKIGIEFSYLFVNFMV